MFIVRLSLSLNVAGNIPSATACGLNLTAVDDGILFSLVKCGKLELGFGQMWVMSPLMKW